MPAISAKPRFVRFTLIVVVAVLLLGVAMCHSSDTHTGSPAKPTVTAAAPDLLPRTWYGMPAYANADGKVVVFFQDSGKFSYRYSTLGFQEAASLDDADMWPVAYALVKWSPTVEKKVAGMVKAAVS